LSPFQAPSPSPKAIAALSRLEEPSGPRPLPGSVGAGPDSFVIEASPAEARDAYQAPDAPLPAGSSVERAGVVVVVRAPFGDTGILFSTASAGCLYTFLREPTLEIEGFPELPHMRAYAAVAYEDKDLMSGEPASQLLSEFWVEDKPWLISAGRLDEGRRRDSREGGAILQTSFKEAQALGDDFRPPNWPARFTPHAAGVGVVIDAPDGPVTVRARPTTGLCGLMASLAAPGG
jgi:hypothetical protein